MRDSDHVFPFSPMDCNPRYRFPFHSRLHRQQYSSTPVCFKQTILPPPSDIQVWTDGSVPSLFGPGGAGVYVTCSKCNPSEHAHMGTTWVFGGQLGYWALFGPIYWGPSGLSLGLNELL